MLLTLGKVIEKDPAEKKRKKLKLPVKSFNVFMWIIFDIVLTLFCLLPSIPFHLDSYMLLTTIMSEQHSLEN